jgi:DNA repair exonuclease SbcCD ATPase subunit
VQAGQDADRAARDAAEAQTQYENHPLYPAAERELEERLREMGPPEKPAPVAAYALGAVLTIAACGAAWGLWRGHWPVFGVAAGIALLCAAALVFTSRSRRRQFARQLADANRRQAELEQEIDTYRALQRRAGESAAHAAQARTIAGHMARQQEEQLRAILSEVRQFQEAAVSLDGAEVALVQARQQRDALAAARQSARDAALRRDLLGSRLPRSEDMPAADAELPAPAMDLAQVEQLLPEAAVRVQTEQSQLDTLRGRIAALGSGEALSAEITQRQEELDRLQGEYDAIALAMETLEAANTTLQSRFSPALGERAAAYLSRITGGRYRKVLLDRSFALAAETEDDPIRRSIQLLSQGTADQVYLSLRLAICDMVLPQEASVPLILDDALTSFDDERLRGALEVLLEESRRRQILLFTCQRREAELLCGREGVFVTEL